MPLCHPALRGDDVATAQGRLVRLHRRLFAQFTARFMRRTMAGRWADCTSYCRVSRALLR